MSLNRRAILGASAAAGVGAAMMATPAYAKSISSSTDNRGGGSHNKGRKAKRYAFTVMGTADLHGHVFNWDSGTDGEYSDADGNAKGLSRIATLVKQVREEKGCGNTILIDAGDTIQGTPLAYYYAKVDPIIAPSGPIHPMAQAMNTIGFDAAALGNHEFNYGIENLRAFEQQCEFPLLAANCLDAETGQEAFPPYHIIKLRTPRGKDVQVAILGLTNPGIAVWDKSYVEGVLTFPGLEEQAAKWVPKLREMGADVVIVSAHSGTSGESAYSNDLIPHVENAAALVAQQVPGIDAILVGHAHTEYEEIRILNEETGAEVVLSEPLYHAQRLTLFDFELVWDKGNWNVESVSATLRDSADVDDDPEIMQLLHDEHTDVVGYVNQVVGQNTTDLNTVEACYKDEPIIDLIMHVQKETVIAGLAGTEYADLPVIAQASPFSRTAIIPAGDVTIRDLSSLYIYDNTMVAKLMTGAQMREYLEYSAQYFVQTAVGADIDPAALTNADARRDYNYDYVSDFTYEIDISQANGSRIMNLQFDGAEVDDAQEFVLAVNNYRANGGGAYPYVATAQELWQESIEIRTRIIEWVTAKGNIDPADFAVENWILTREGTPVF